MVGGVNGCGEGGGFGGKQQVAVGNQGDRDYQVWGVQVWGIGLNR